MARPFDLVVFDLGGVLIRIARSWAEAHERAGLSLPLPGPDLDARLTALSKQEFSLQSGDFYRLAAEASDGSYSSDDVRRMSEAWLLGEYPGLDGVFDRLELSGVDAALLSNTNDPHWRRVIVDDSGSREFANVRRAQRRYASHLLGLAKPDPRIYEAVEDDCGHAPARILFDDDAAANVEAARACGWTAEHIDHTGDTAAQLLEALRRYEVTR
ncbi:MAG: HAD-IA family hydrolase [Chloroflexi bacterium]|nr:HAD-IA family hydrolase [Chloroflexota bacterium]